ncbi:MAG: hypothetical protein BRC29_00175 [Nanohaloarchaea archaeon SW_7_43_1]|nr:MAG: hypothetical protein BRC29_00175 [Nanohaloarchaea archaeon SW_7_43_1]
MKSIKKLKSTGKAVAGSALLVGATLTGAAGLASASSHNMDDSGSMDLGDYPMPFVNEDGEVDTTVVVGEQAATADVVGAINVAGSLGNAAFMEEEVDVDVSGATATYSAEDGETLNRRNSDLFFGQGTAAEQVRFDGQDINALETTTVSSVSNEEVELEHDLMIGDQPQSFNSERGDVDDPVLHIKNPSSDLDVNSDYLLQGEVEFDETMDFTTNEGDPSDGADQILEDGETLELFGQEYTYSDESEADELVLYGSSTRFEADTGETTTVEVDGEEQELGVEYVQEGENSATITVNGDTQSVDDGETITVNGEDIRVSDIFRTGPDGEGTVKFSIGSEELVVTNSDVEVDGESVDGVDVALDAENDDFTAVDGISFAFGAQDSDENLVQAGETYETPVFGLEFHYAGLAPNAAEEPAGEIEVDATEDDDVSLDYTADSGEDVSLTLGEPDDSGNFDPGPGDEDEQIAQYEGQQISEDDYTVLNSNEEAVMVEVTNVDDSDLQSGEDDGELSVSLSNAATDESMTVEEDGLNLSSGSDDLEDDGSYELQSESIEGMDYDVTWHGNEQVSFVRSTRDDGHVQLHPHMYTNTGAAVAVDAPGALDASEAFAVTTEDFTSPAESQSMTEDGSAGQADFQLDLGSISGTDSDDVELRVAGTTDGSNTYDETVTLDDSGDSASFGTSPSNVDVSRNGEDTIEFTLSANSGAQVTELEVQGAGASGDVGYTPGSETEAGDYTTLTVSPATRTADLPSGVASNDATADVEFQTTEELGKSVDTNEDFVQYTLDGAQGDETVNLSRGNTQVNHTAVLVTEPEDDEDDEQAYVVEGRTTDSSQNVDVTYTGGEDLRDTESLDDESVEVGYDFYGAHTMFDTENSDTDNFKLHLPEAQSTAGMAVTGADGSLSASGASSGSAMTMSPTGFPDSAALDSEVSGSDRDQNMILVGGPAVNSLTEELAQENKTWTRDNYDEDTWVLDLVDGFREGTHALVVAGHSADDTRAASSYISNYADNADELAGETTVNMTTSASQ